jgi:cation:H+ antiporter
VFQHASLIVLLALFAAGALATWFAGVRVGIATDILTQRYHLGQALGGEILLGIVVNLPEIAIVAAASYSGHLGLAIGNLLGGIAIQTVVLVLLDFVAVHDRPLSFAGASLTLVLQAAFLVAMLAITMMGMPLHLPVVLRMTPVGLLLIALWVFGLWMLKRASTADELPWTDHGVPPDLVAKRREDISVRQEQIRAKEAGRAVWVTWAVFVAGSLITLAGGVVLEQASEQLAQLSHLGGVVFGATVLAAVTALPEVSTGLESIRLGDYELAFADIFGSNAFLPVCLPLITLISGRDPLPLAGGTNLYLCALGALVTVVYLGGLIFRPQRQYLRLGPDSWTVLVAYVLGIAALVFVR